MTDQLFPRFSDAEYNRRNIIELLSEHKAGRNITKAKVPTTIRVVSAGNIVVLKGHI